MKLIIDDNKEAFAYIICRTMDGDHYFCSL